MYGVSSEVTTAPNEGSVDPKSPTLSPPKPWNELRRSWAKDHEKEIVALIRGVIAAHDYIFTDKAGAIQTMRARIKDLGAPEAEAIYADLTEGRGGLNRKAEINVEGVKNLLALRSQYGEPKMTLTDPNKYIDLSYYEKATKGMK